MNKLLVGLFMLLLAVPATAQDIVDLNLEYEAYQVSKDEVILVFSEEVSTASATNPSNYIISGDLNIISATKQSPQANKVKLKASAPFESLTEYTITVGNVTDIYGNPIVAITDPRVYANPTVNSAVFKSAKEYWYDSAWTKRVKISIFTNQLVADSTLTDFTLLLDENQLQDVFDDAKSDGSDIVITAKNGATVLPHRIIDFSPNNSPPTAQIWFKAPVLDRDHFEFYVYYGNPAANVSYTQGDEFASFVEGAWMYENVPTASPSIPDYSSNNYDLYGLAGSGEVWSSIDVVDGKIGKALEYKANKTTRVDNVNMTSVRWSVSGWINTNTSSDTNALIATDDPVWFDLYCNQAEYKRRSFLPGYGPVEPNDPPILSLRYSTTSIPLARQVPGEWQFYTWVFDGLEETLTFYKNGISLGALRAEDVIQFVPGSTTGATYTGVFVPHGIGPNKPLGVGSTQSPATKDAMKGKVDNVKLYSKPLSPTWILTEYRNQNNTQAFYSTGIEEVNNIVISSIDGIVYDRQILTLNGSKFRYHAAFTEGEDLLYLDFDGLQTGLMVGDPDWPYPQIIRGSGAVTTAPQQIHRVIDNSPYGSISGNKVFYGKALSGTPMSSFQYENFSKFDEFYISYWIYMEPIGLVAGDTEGQWKIWHVGASPCFAGGDNDQFGGMYMTTPYNIVSQSQSRTGMIWGSVDPNQSLAEELKSWSVYAPSYYEGSLNYVLNLEPPTNTDGYYNITGTPQYVKNWTHFEIYMKTSRTFGNWGTDGIPSDDDPGRDAIIRYRITRNGVSNAWDYYRNGSVITNMHMNYVQFDSDDCAKDPQTCTSDNPLDCMVPAIYDRKFNRFNWYNTWFNGGTEADFYEDNIYIQIGTRARVMVANNPQYHLANRVQPQKPVLWSNNKINVELELEPFLPEDSLYLFVINEDGEISPAYPITISNEPVNNYYTITTPTIQGELFDVPVYLPTAAVGSGPYKVLVNSSLQELPVQNNWVLMDSLYTDRKIRVYNEPTTNPNSAWPANWKGVFHFEQSPLLGIAADSGQNDYHMEAYQGSGNGTLGWWSDTRVPGILGQAWHTDAESLRVLRSQDQYSDDGTYTISSWVKLDSNTNDTLIQADPGFWNIAAQTTSNGKSQFTDFGRVGAPDSDIIVSWQPDGGMVKNVWNHVLYTFDSANNLIEYYLNGIKRSVHSVIGTGPSNQPNDANNMWSGYTVGGGSNYVSLAGPIFWGDGSTAFDGAIDETFIIDKKLSTSEIDVLYRNQKDPNNWWVYVGTDQDAPILNNGIVYNNSTELVISFNENMDPATVADVNNYSISPNVLITDVTQVDGSSVIINTAIPFTDLQRYTVIVNNVEDLSGNVIASNSQTSATYYTPNANAPQISSVQVYVAYQLMINFDQVIQSIVKSGFKVYIWDGDSYLDNPVSVNPLGWVINGNTQVKIYKDNAFPTNTWYVVEIAPNSITGVNGLTQSQKLTFFKEVGNSPVPGPNEQDTTPPVMSSVQVNGLTQFVANFTEALMDTSATKLNNWTIYPTAQGPGSPITIQNIVLNPSTTVTLTTEQLQYDTQYTVSSAFIRDLAGNPSSTRALNVTTETSPDAFPPTPLTFSDPDNNTILITFDEPVDPVTGAHKTNYTLYFTSSPGTKFTINSATVLANTVSLNLAININNDAEVTLEVRNIGDVAGNYIAPGTTVILTNNVTKKAAIITGLTTPDFSTIEIQYDELVTDITNVTYSVSAFGVPKTVTNKVLSGSTVSITVTPPFSNNDAIFVQSSGGEIDSQGNPSPVSNGFTLAAVPGTDLNPPTIRSATGGIGSTVLVEFNEPVRKPSSENKNNWTIGGEVVGSAVRSDVDSTQVTITAATPLQSYTTYTLTANAISDSTGNKTGLLSTTFVSADTIAPSIISVAAVDSANIDIEFSESVQSADVTNINNYKVWLFGSTYPNDALTINSVSLVSGNIYRINTSEMLTETVYNLEVTGVRDILGNFTTNNVSFATLLGNQTVKITFTNTRNTAFYGFVRAIVPFTNDIGPTRQTSEISMYEFSLENAAGQAQLAEFETLSFDPADSSITELLVTAVLSIPANSSVDRWLVWDLSEPNLPAYTDLLSTTTSNLITIVDNNFMRSSFPSDRLAPVSDLTFDLSSTPALRTSYYSLVHNNTTYSSTGRLLEFNYTDDGSVYKEVYAAQKIGPVTVQSYVDIFLDEKFINIETRVTNPTNAPIQLQSLSLNWPVTSKFRTLYYKSGNASNFSPGVNSGLVIKQDTNGYTVTKDNSTVLVNLSGIDNPPGDYNSWIASLANNGRWHVALIPSVINRSNPRTIGRIGERLFDEMINTSTVIAPGETKTYNTLIFLEIGAVDINELNSIIPTSPSTTINGETTTSYRDGSDLPPPRTYDRELINNQ